MSRPSRPRHSPTHLDGYPPSVLLVERRRSCGWARGEDATVARDRGILALGGVRVLGCSGFRGGRDGDSGLVGLVCGLCRVARGHDMPISRARQRSRGAGVWIVSGCSRPAICPSHGETAVVLVCGLCRVARGPRYARLMGETAVVLVCRLWMRRPRYARLMGETAGVGGCRGRRVRDIPTRAQFFVTPRGDRV
jgi:hypothetical protein